MSNLLITTCNQFGFKSKLGTNTCIYALKEIVENHRSLNGSMFMRFLDASKAFDRLKHSLLFQKSIDRKVPGYIIRIMIYWYASQIMYVRWSGILSHGFHVANGVRQGGILSPYLCIYILMTWALLSPRVARTAVWAIRLWIISCMRMT